MARAAAVAMRLEGTTQPEYLDTLGWIALHTGERERAIELLERAVAGLPANATVHYHLSEAYARAGREEDAATMLQRATALDSTNTLRYQRYVAKDSNRSTGGVVEARPSE
ncbi:MAG: tetratricopeptide repeat protein [Paracoccaceae bacterium]